MPVSPYDRKKHKSKITKAGTKIKGGGRDQDSKASRVKIGGKVVNDTTRPKARPAKMKKGTTAEAAPKSRTRKKGPVAGGTSSKAATTLQRGSKIRGKASQAGKSPTRAGPKTRAKVKSDKMKTGPSTRGKASAKKAKPMQRGPKSRGTPNSNARRAKNARDRRNKKTFHKIKNFLKGN